ncbi:enoyl-CoA hydratase-related protein [Kiloniella antarctica]|uniref:Enoyl-CoA hydratase-related protein n=1 Tax=Kiloniella antarctica TaxID=1550907 RepID=A0ABW5BII7_9PROT
MRTPFFVEETGADGVAYITLTNLETHNSLNGELIGELIDALIGIENDKRVRVLIIAAKGPTFCGGADLKWLKSMSVNSSEKNLVQARYLKRLMSVLDNLRVPTIARVQGNVYGGGIGLLCCCDIVVAMAGTFYSMSEVRMGLIPAITSPYLLRTIGVRQARRYVLTGEKLTASQALEIGLIHQVVRGDMIDITIEGVIKNVLKAGPRALRLAKQLVSDVAGRKIDDTLLDETIHLTAKACASDEGLEGIRAFLEKRDPEWPKKSI